MKFVRSLVLIAGVSLLAASPFSGCATRADDPDGGSTPARDGGVRADGGALADGGGTLTDGGGVRQDGGGGSRPGTPTTIELIQGSSVLPQTCVQIDAVAMSAVFTDSDDSKFVDGGRVSRKAFYVSMKGIATTAPFTGIEVVIDPDFGFTAPVLSPGDDVQLSGEYQENFNNSTIRLTAGCNDLRIVGTAATPSPAVVTLAEVGQTGGDTACPTSAWVEGSKSEDYEGVLMKVSAGTVSNPNDFSQIEVTDGTAKLLINKALGVTATPSLGDAIGANGVVGFGHFGFCRRKIRPRNNSEVGFAVAPVNCGSAAKVTNKLLITEVRIGFTSAEFIEIHNPTSSAIDLSDYYLYNATFAATTDGGTSSDGGTSVATRYYLTPTGGQGGTRSGDFALQFPAGATIAAGEYQVVALGSAAGYCSAHTCPTAAAKPNYEIPPPAGCGAATDDSAVLNMRGNWDPAPANTCNDGGLGGFGYLTGASEEVILFKWTSGQPNVQDVDYFIWGTSLDIRTSKTGVGTYLADTAVGSQRAPAGSISVNQSYQRVCMNEGTQTRTGGNGITGSDETSENLDQTFVVRDPTPKAATVGATP